MEQQKGHLLEVTGPGERLNVVPPVAERAREGADRGLPGNDTGQALGEVSGGGRRGGHSRCSLAAAGPAK